MNWPDSANKCETKAQNDDGTLNVSQNPKDFCKPNVYRLIHKINVNFNWICFLCISIQFLFVFNLQIELSCFLCRQYNSFCKFHDNVNNLHKPFIQLKDLILHTHCDVTEFYLNILFILNGLTQCLWFFLKIIEFFFFSHFLHCVAYRIVMHSLCANKSSLCLRLNERKPKVKKKNKIIKNKLRQNCWKSQQKADITHSGQENRK